MANYEEGFENGTATLAEAVLLALELDVRLNTDTLDQLRHIAERVRMRGFYPRVWVNDFYATGLLRRPERPPGYRAR